MKKPVNSNRKTQGNSTFGVLAAALLIFSVAATSCHREACPGAITGSQVQPEEQIQQELSNGFADQSEYQGEDSAPLRKSGLNGEG